MDATTSFAPSTITCAKPGCGTVTTLAESGYIDGCGQVCLDCFGGHRVLYTLGLSSFTRTMLPERLTRIGCGNCRSC
jgi:hypothetical protein